MSLKRLARVLLKIQKRFAFDLTWTFLTLSGHFSEIFHAILNA
jgi:hypothetical protein